MLDSLWRLKREKPHARARTHILNAFYQGCIPDSFAYLELFFSFGVLKNAIEKALTSEVLVFTCVFVT